MEKDVQIFNLIAKESDRQEKGLELIASENFVSKQVLEAAGSILTNKYAEGLPWKRYYGGCEVIDEIETIAIERAKELFHAAWANVQPHSGAQANLAVFLALLKPGDKILGFDLAHGGHLTHGSPVNFSGKYFQASFYGVARETGLVDYKQLEQIALKEKPKLIICGASAYARDWDYAFIRQVADQIGALVLADISHPAGFIAKKLLNDPLLHCDVVTTTTHKTLRGPRGGMILIGKDFENQLGLKTAKGDLRMFSSILDGAVFPGTQGGPLEHIIAAKAIAFREAMSEDYRNYILQVRKNAQAMAKALINLGYQISSRGTDNHLLLIDLRNKNMTGKEAELALGNAGITVNKNMIPFDDRSSLITSGIRVGTPAITTRGFQETHMDSIAHFMDEAMRHPDDLNTLKKIREEVQRMVKAYPLYS